MFIPRLRSFRCEPSYARYAACYGFATTDSTHGFSSCWQTYRRSGLASSSRSRHHGSTHESDLTSAKCWFRWSEQTCRVPTSCSDRSVACGSSPTHGRTCSRYHVYHKYRCQCLSYSWSQSTHEPSMSADSHTSYSSLSVGSLAGNQIHQETSCSNGKQTCS